MSTDEDDQDGHFFFNPPEKGATSLPRRAQPLLLLFRSTPPMGGVGGEIIRPTVKPKCRWIIRDEVHWAFSRQRASAQYTAKCHPA